MDEIRYLFDEKPLLVGIDFGRGDDSTAICIAQQCKAAGIRIVAMVDTFQQLTLETMAPFMDKLIREYSRPRGYSQSHWRKIFPASQARRPIRILSDGEGIQE